VLEIRDVNEAKTLEAEAEAEAKTHEAEAEAEAKTHEAEAEAEAKPSRPRPRQSVQVSVASRSLNRGM